MFVVILFISLFSKYKDGVFHIAESVQLHLYLRKNMDTPIFFCTRLMLRLFINPLFKNAAIDSFLSVTQRKKRFLFNLCKLHHGTYSS